MTVFDLADRDYGVTPPLAAAAVETWLSEVVKAGGWPVTSWPPALHQRARGRAAAFAAVPAAVAGTWPQDSPVPFRGRWRLRHATWEKVLASALAAAPVLPVLHGAAAISALGDVRDVGAQVRLVDFRFTDAAGRPVSGAVGIVVGERDVHLFEPATGLHRFRLGGASGADGPLQWFARLMSTSYGASSDIACVTRLVDILDVFFTWLGPPRAAPDPKDGTWSDVKGPLAMARSGRVAGPGVPDGNSPHVTLVCMATHRPQVLNRLNQVDAAAAATVDVRTIEDHFAGGLGLQGTLNLSRPDFVDLKASVRTMLAHSLADPGDLRAVVNAKNIWSLYCLYTFGGYHMDTGVVPPNRQTRPRPTPPDRFATMWADMGQTTAGFNDGSRFEHNPLLRSWSGVHCMSSTHSQLGHPKTLYRKQDLGPETTFACETVDVGIMRSPRRDLGVETALRAYLDLWFRIQTMRASGVHHEPSRLPGDALTELYAASIVTAAATGLSHPRPAPGPGRAATATIPTPVQAAITLPCDLVLPRPGDGLFRPRDIGVIKTGMQSHRKQPVVQPLP